MGLFARWKNFLLRKKPQPLKLGIALGSGGAKGFVHLGILSAFEEEGIVFSHVTGTSIGAIIGALYAKGFTANDILGIVSGLNRKEFSKNLRPFTDLSFAERFLEDYLEGDIAMLPKPFATCATDADNNEYVLLDRGPITKAVTASSAYPPIFKAVRMDGKELYDGAFTDAIPADVCKDLGADFVIGVDLSAYSRKEEEKGRLSRMMGTAVSYIMPVKYRADCKTRGYEAADYMIRPPLRDYSPTDISQKAMDEMFLLGYEEAKHCMTEIKAAIAERERRGGDTKRKL